MSKVPRTGAVEAVAEGETGTVGDESALWPGDGDAGETVHPGNVTRRTMDASKTRLPDRRPVVTGSG
jgi:hypothetical protein